MGSVVYRATNSQDAAAVRRLLRSAGLSPEVLPAEIWGREGPRYPVAVPAEEVTAAVRILTERAAREERALRPLVRPIRRAVLCGLAAGALAGSSFAWRARDPLATGVLVGAAVAVVTACVALLLLSRTRKPTIDPVCPKCGYSLVRLTRPRCPECGTRFSPSVFEARRAARMRRDAEEDP
jgi:hypothetical protein